MSRFAHLPPAVARPLRAYYRRRQTYLLLRDGVLTAIVYLLLALVAMHVDRFLFLTTVDRVRLLHTVNGLAALALAWLLARFFWRRPTSRRLAYELERALPGDADERFVTLDALHREAPHAADNPVRADLMRFLEDEASAYAGGLAGGHYARRRGLLWALLGLGLAGAVYGLLLLPASYQFPLMAERFFRPRQPLPKPSFVQLTVTPAKLIVGRGGEAVLQAEVTGELPGWLAWTYRRLGLPATGCRLDIMGQPEEEMARVQRRLYLASKTNLTEGFRYRVRSGDAVTPWQKVEVIDQPKIDSLRLTATPPPAYASLAPQTFDNPTETLSFLAGTQIALRFTTDQEVATPQLFLAGQNEPVAPEWDAASRTGTWETTLAEPLTLEIRVVNTHGFANLAPAVVSIGLREDQPPSVTLESPAADVEVVRGELVPLVVALRDDFGLAGAAVRFQVNPDPATETAFRELPVALPEGSPLEAAATVPFDLEETGAVPGDVIVLAIRARDGLGNDGTSRPLAIRVVAFTRGENERLRLRVLRFLGTAFTSVGLAADAIERDAWSAIRDDAAKLGLGLPENPSLAALFAIAEREHHFIDDPRDKTALRQTIGLLAAGRPEPLALLPALTAYRQLKNLTWRLYGLRDEARAIHARYTEFAASEKPDPTQMESTQRRASLYLDILQDVGGELLELARVVDELDAAALDRRQAEIAEAGYRLKRGSPASRAERASLIVALLEEQLALLRPAYAPLREQEAAARQELERLYDALLAAPPDAAWFAAQQRLLEVAPFAGFAPRLRLLVLTDGGSLDDALTAPATAEAAWLDWLVRAWQRDTIERLERIGDDERQLALELLAAEAPAAPPNTSPASVTAELVALADTWGGLARWDADLRAIADATQALPPMPEGIDNLVRLARTVGPRLDDRLLRLSLSVRYLPMPEAEAQRAELLLLRLRAALERYRLNLAPALSTLGPIDQPLTPEQQTDLLQDVPRLAVPLQSLHANLAKALAEYDASVAAEAFDRPFALLDIFDRTRRYRDTIASLPGSPEPAATATAFLDAFPEARVDFVISRAPRLLQVRRALDLASTQLAAEPLPAAEYHDAIAAAQDALAGFVATLPEGDALAADATELANLLRTLPIPPERQADPVVQRQRRFSLGEATRLLDRVERRVDQLGQESPEDGFRGGPPGIWEDETRRDAEQARQRLLSQLELARRQATLGIVAALDDPPPTANTLREANAWARFAFAAVRSELTGPARQRPPRREQPDGGSRLVAWLLDELNESAKAARTDAALPPYRDLTVDYLDRLADYLRY